MKKIALFFMAASLLAWTGCDSDNDKPEEPVEVADGTYRGTVTVDQNDGTFFNKENVDVVVTFEDGKAQIDLKKVKFANAMPELDITIPGVTIAETAEGYAISGENIVPLAMGGQFPAYTITGLTGKVTPETFAFEMMCGVYPTSFSGEKVE